MENILIIGASGHAKVVVDLVGKLARYKLVGLVDKGSFVGGTLLGYPVLGAQDDLPAIVSKHNVSGFIVAIGDNYTRAEVALKTKGQCPSVPFVSLVHPNAHIGLNTRLGEGSVVMAGACVGADVTIGPQSIVNSNSTVEHLS